MCPAHSVWIVMRSYVTSCAARCRNRKGVAHKIVKLSDELKPEFTRYRGSYCDQHSDELVKMYCCECKVNICTVCFAVKHRGHKCLEIQDVAKEFRKQIDGNMQTLSVAVMEIIKDKRKQ